MICTCLIDTSIQGQLETAKKWVGFSRMFEVRLDYVFRELEKTGDFSQVFLLGTELLKLNRRVVFTARHHIDGGLWPLEMENLRLSFLREIGVHFRENPRVYLDLELDRRSFLPSELLSSGDVLPDYDGVGELNLAFSGHPIQRVRSIHSFIPWVPKNGVWVKKWSEAVDSQGIFKAALMPGNTEDLVQLFRLGKELDIHRPGKSVVLGMGAWGVPTRILSSKISSLWTYATPENHQDSVVAAPGQLSPRALEEDYGYSRIDRNTRVFGIFGNPVGHSKSPEYHNRVFSQESAVYVAFPVDDINQGFTLAQELDIQGLSITIPHKEKVLPYLNQRDTGVEFLGACNTMIRKNSGWFGTNTDVPGFLEPLVTNGQIETIKKAMVIGAGGAARAVVYALLTRGIKVRILNRTREKADQLVKDLDRGLGLLTSEILAPKSWGGETPDLIVQTTSVGMDGKSDPLEGYVFTGNEIVYDILYSPPRTPVLERADRAGCQTLNGWLMFLGQALYQSRLFLQRIRELETREHHPGN